MKIEEMKLGEVYQFHIPPEDFVIDEEIYETAELAFTGVLESYINKGVNHKIAVRRVNTKTITWYNFDIFDLITEVK